MKKVIQFLWFLPRRGLMAFFRLYQKILSPDHSFWAKAFYPQGYCPFQPSCSQYMIEALEKYGAIRGLFKGIWRIFRCNPWAKGGSDVV